MAESKAEYFKEYNKKRAAYLKDYSKNVRYKNNKKICAFVDREKSKMFEEKLKKDNLSITEFVNQAIDKYIKED